MVGVGVLLAVFASVFAGVFPVFSGVLLVANYMSLRPTHRINNQTKMNMLDAKRRKIFLTSPLNPNNTNNMPRSFIFPLQK